MKKQWFLYKHCIFIFWNNSYHFQTNVPKKDCKFFYVGKMVCIQVVLIDCKKAFILSDDILSTWRLLRKVRNAIFELSFKCQKEETIAWGRTIAAYAAVQFTVTATAHKGKCFFYLLNSDFCCQIIICYLEIGLLFRN